MFEKFLKGISKITRKPSQDIPNSNFDKGIEVSNEIRYNSEPVFKEIKVATVMDQFSYDSYRYECNLIYLRPGTWKETFEKEKPDFFFCESAFDGLRTEEHPRGEWGNQIFTNLNNPKENRQLLFSILEYCHENDIPTVFWNKEDPPRFYNEIGNFVDTSLRFDYLFTSDEDCVSRYVELGHDNVHCLMFASQPKLFNPIRIGERSDDVVFAGSWYKKHKQRCIVMNQIFDRILEEGYNLKIYDRMFERKQKKFTYPDKYQKYVNPGVHYSQMPAVYKESNLELNFNTVTESPTMFARRVFELMASNTVVLSNYSKAVDLLFKDNVVFLDMDVNLDDYDFDRIREENLYDVLDNHTYSNRFMQILDTVGIEYSLNPNHVSIVCSLEDYQDISGIVSQFEAITYACKSLKIIVSEIPDDGLATDIEYEIILRDDLNDWVFNLNDDDYICFANSSMDCDFIRKALLHYKYLPKDYGIAATEDLSIKYTFDRSGDIHNIVFSNAEFKSVYKKNCDDFEIYYI